MRSKIQYLAQPFNKMDSNKLDELILNINTEYGHFPSGKKLIQ